MRRVSASGTILLAGGKPVTRSARKTGRFGRLFGRMNWRVRLAVTLVVFLILSRFLPPLDSVVFASLLLVLMSLFLHNLARVSNINKIEAQVKNYLELYFRQRTAGATVDGALSNVVYSRFPFNYRMKMVVFEGLREYEPEDDDEKVKRTVYVMFKYEEPVPPGPEALEVIKAVIDHQYGVMKEQYGSKLPELTDSKEAHHG